MAQYFYRDVLVPITIAQDDEGETLSDIAYNIQDIVKSMQKGKQGKFNIGRTIWDDPQPRYDNQSEPGLIVADILADTTFFDFGIKVKQEIVIRNGYDFNNNVNIDRNIYIQTHYMDYIEVTHGSYMEDYSDDIIENMKARQYIDVDGRPSAIDVHPALIKLLNEFETLLLDLFEQVANKVTANFS